MVTCPSKKYRLYRVLANDKLVPTNFTSESANELVNMIAILSRSSLFIYVCKPDIEIAK